MVVTSYLMARSEFSSTFTLPTLTRPETWSAILSMMGVRARPGPHHGAQKSTRTGWLDCASSVFQFSVVNSCTFLLAIGCLLRVSGPPRPDGTAGASPWGCHNFKFSPPRETVPAAPRHAHLYAWGARTIRPPPAP